MKISSPLGNRNSCRRMSCCPMTSCLACTNFLVYSIAFGQAALVNWNSTGPTIWILHRNWVFDQRKLDPSDVYLLCVSCLCFPLFAMCLVFVYISLIISICPCEEYGTHVPVSCIYLQYLFYFVLLVKVLGLGITSYIISFVFWVLKSCVPRYDSMVMALMPNNTLSWCLCWQFLVGHRVLLIVVWHSLSEIPTVHPPKQGHWFAK